MALFGRILLTGNDGDGRLPPNGKTQRRNRDATAALWRSQRAAWIGIGPLPAGPALIVIVLLSIGLWATIGAAISLIVSAMS